MITFKELGKMGRLGNMLFQMAATAALALRNNDTYVFPPWEYEPYFNLHNCFSNNITNTDTFIENGFTYTPIPYRPNLHIRGFFQSEKYFEDQQDIIHHLLTPKKGFGIKWGHTSIHVRRGDYVGQAQNHPPLDMNYYNKAMEMIGSQHYIVFSDDINWCKHYFTGSNIIFSEGQSPADDLSLMLSCENNIIANSSFSWWGAWLNKNPSKIVIAPSSWFGPGLPHNIRDLIPQSWTKI